jgi:hypothetical protein
LLRESHRRKKLEPAALGEEGFEDARFEVSDSE